MIKIQTQKTMDAEVFLTKNPEREREGQHKNYDLNLRKDGDIRRTYAGGDFFQFIERT